MRFKRNDKRKVRANVEMTPLIDVVFQLLIFFMLSSTFVVQTSIPIEVPQTEGAEQYEHKDLTITLAYGQGGPDNQGMVLLDDVEVTDWGELTRALAERHRTKPDIKVLIRPDKRIPTGRTVKVLGIAHAVGIEFYGIGAEPPQEDE